MRLSDWSSDVCSSDRFWRGLPLVAILFMSVIMLPLFLPPGVEAPRLSLALAGITFYSAAYLAEVVRGGLQGIGRGQYEAAGALGFGFWSMQGYEIGRAWCRERVVKNV